MIFQKTIIVILFFFTSLFSTEINYSSKNLFPLHKELEPAVQFWINVYAKYNTNQYVIHDSRHLDVIYEVYKIGAVNGGYAEQPLNKAQKKELKERTKQYKNILNSIAAVYPDSAKLNPAQKKVLRKLNRFKSKKGFYQAARRIRAQKGQKNRFRHGLKISGRYMPFLKEIFKKYNLPWELTVLPHVESSFNYQAYSSVGAAGIWQFTRSTGKQFLKISYEVDERLDPILATEAAAKLLTRNYKGVGHWPLAITAYNSGLSGIKRAVKKLKTTEIHTIAKKYRSRYFKFASRNFYPEFLAALHVVQNYQKYFGEIAFEEPVHFKEFPLPKYLKYETLAKYLAIDKTQFCAYNPALRPSIFNNSKFIPKGYRMRLPDHISTDSLLAAIPQSAYLARQKRSEYYRIRYGDTLSDIARRFGTSVELLLALNNISNEHFIRRGMTIRIPDKKSTLPLLAAIDTKRVLPINNSFMMVSAEEEILELKITLPDPFWQQLLPEQDSVSSAKPASYANARDKSDLEIEFIQKKKPAIGYIRVEAEETLGHYAEWLQIKTQRIRNWNNLPFRTAIHLNQKIKLIFDHISPEEFNRARLEYHIGLEEDFFMHYEITGTQSHTVRSGDNIWYLCNYEYNLPLWLIVSYNKSLNFETLRTGDKLTIPTIKSRG
jgi:peptidoglycan lytic transglycosylase D